MATVQLTDKVQADIRPALGSDEVTTWEVRAKFEPFLEDRPRTGAEYMFQAQFALCVVCTNWIKGTDYALPIIDDTGEVLADAYRAWLALPRRLFNAWRQAPDEVEGTFNSPDLLPPDKVNEEARKNLTSAVAVPSNGKR